MSGLSVKGKASGTGGKGKAKRPRRTAETIPAELTREICWFDLDDTIKAYNDGSRRVKGKVVDWKKLGGVFLPNDILIFRFSQFGIGVADLVFEWQDITRIYPTLKGDTKLARAIAPYTKTPNANTLSELSPQPCFVLDFNQSVEQAGVFVFVLELSQMGSSSGENSFEDVDTEPVTEEPKKTTAKKKRKKAEKPLKKKGKKFKFKKRK